MRPSFSSTRTGQIRTIRSAIATLWARWSAVIISRVTSMSLPIAMPSRVSSVGNSVYTFHVLLQYYTHRSLMHLFGPAVLVVRSSHNFSHNLTISQSSYSRKWKIENCGVWACMFEWTDNKLARIDCGAWRHAQYVAMIVSLGWILPIFPEIMRSDES